MWIKMHNNAYVNLNSANDIRYDSELNVVTIICGDTSYYLSEDNKIEQILAINKKLPINEVITLGDLEYRIEKEERKDKQSIFRKIVDILFGV